MRESDVTGNVMRMNRIRNNLHRHAGPITAKQRSPGTLRARLSRQTGKLGYILLWLLGVPIPLLFLIFLLRGCT